jgi:aminomethyltransferase
MKQSRLHEEHAKLGATFVERAGWEVPIHYGDPTAEQVAVRSAVGVADLSHRGKCRVTGEDRVKWLQSVISNDILSLSPGRGLYSSLLTHKGKMLTYFRVYVQPEAIVIEDVGEIGDATFLALRKFLLYGTKARLENCGDTWGLLLVSGPRAHELIQSAFRLDLQRLNPLAFVTANVPPAFSSPPSTAALFIKTEETGESDVAILVPAEGLVGAWRRLWEAGAAFGLRAFGEEARDVLRLEAGLPLAGRDLTEEIVPPEANLEGKAFSLSKGCYPGQEVMARMDTYGSVRRRLVGLVLADPMVPPPGAKLFSGDREVGWISSAAYSPTLKQPIALGFPLRDFAAPGTELTVELDGRRHAATVHALPFYSKS